MNNFCTQKNSQISHQINFVRRARAFLRKYDYCDKSRRGRRLPNRNFNDVLPGDVILASLLYVFFSSKEFKRFISIHISCRPTSTIADSSVLKYQLTNNMSEFHLPHRAFHQKYLDRLRKLPSKEQQLSLGDLRRHCKGLGKGILMPYPINQFCFQIMAAGRHDATSM